MDSQTIVSLATPVVVPLIIAGVKKVLPSLPTWLLPVLTPFLGASVDVINHFATGSATNIVLSSLLGLAGVGVREVVDQLKSTTTGNP